MNSPPLVTISGSPGSGTTTLSENIAKKFNFEHVSGGDIFRQVASNRGMTLAELTRAAETDDSIDKDLDARIEEIAQLHASNNRDPDGDGLLIESRLAGWLAGENADMRVFLHAPLEVRLARIDDRNETAEELAEREESEAGRYMEYYGIDVRDRSIYDCVLNTSEIGETEMISIVTNEIDGLIAEHEIGI